MASDRVVKLGRRGIVAFEMQGGILGRLTGKSSKDADLRRALPPIIRLVGIVAEHVRQRVRDKRKTAFPWRGYSTKGKVLYAPRVRALSGLRKVHKSSAAVPRKGLFAVTGAMWEGLEVVAWGRDGGQIGFRGTTAGTAQKKRWVPAGALPPALVRAAGPKRRQVIDGELHIGLRDAFDKNVRNAQKAVAIFKKLGVNVVQLKPSEEYAVADAVGNATADELARFFGGERGSRVTSPVSSASLARKIEALWR